MTNQKKQSSEAAVREIRRRTRRKFSGGSPAPLLRWDCILKAGLDIANQ
jgi:hypothetical protein